MWVYKRSTSAITAVRPVHVKSFEWALVEVMCVWECGVTTAGERVRARQRDSSYLSVCIVLCAPDHVSRRRAPVPDGCCRAGAWCMGPGWLLGAFADSDREAGRWVMEFVPAESESHWQTLAPHGHCDEGSAHSLSLPPCGRAGGTSGHTHGYTQADTDTVTTRAVVERNWVWLGCCNLSEGFASICLWPI